MDIREIIQVSGHRPSLLPSGSNGGRHGIASDGAIRSEAIRHFSEILDSRRSTPQGFFAECYIHRAGAYQFAGRIAEAIADCNRTLALDPTSIPALSMRVSLLETICSYPNCPCSGSEEGVRVNVHHRSVRVRERPGRGRGQGPARMSVLILYRLLQKGYSSLMSAIMDEEAAEKQRQRVAAAPAAAAIVQAPPTEQVPVPAPETPLAAAAVVRNETIAKEEAEEYRGVDRAVQRTWTISCRRRAARRRQRRRRHP
ncbi:hypothetical protein H6P81_006920 [Aristolochia fimbriata]|uniref:Uncharacterized protein n=1 Tax=Aristolochia fimbriata TaxID=158543 RepID=A0AAV7F1F6_ARIFI|nr:hypothetical protein H6P81_006920 [Aristolochia fimbriata]